MKKISMKKVIEETCSEDYEAALFRAVIRQIGLPFQEIFNNPYDFRTASGGVSGFTYYRDTEPFARRNILNILECLWSFEDEIGEPLKKNDSNKLNWLAWFALEHMIDKIIVYKESSNL